MSGTPPRAVSDLLPSALPRLGDHLVTHRVRKAWASLVGAEVARRARPTTLVAGTLTVVVDNSPWLHELTLRADDLTRRVADRFPAVRALRFTVGPLEGEPAGEAARRPRARSLTDADRAQIDAAASAVPDPEVAETVRRVMTKALQFPVTRTP